MLLEQGDQREADNGKEMAAARRTVLEDLGDRSDDEDERADMALQDLSRGYLDD